MADNSQKIPTEWIWVKLDSLLHRISNGCSNNQYKENVGLPITRIETIWNGTIDLNRVRYIKDYDDKLIEKYKLKEGDILFSHINSDSHLGKTAIFKNYNITLVHGINLLLLRPKNQVNKKFDVFV